MKSQCMLTDFAETIRRKAFRSFVGQTLQCTCGSILDYRRSTMVTVEINGKIEFCRVFCSKCIPCDPKTVKGLIWGAVVRSGQIKDGDTVKIETEDHKKTVSDIVTVEKGGE